MRGRKPTPSNLVKLHGNPGKRAINKDEAKPKAKLPACPAHLTGEARREWKRTGGHLLALGLVTEIDRGALALYCQAWGRWVDAEKNLTQFGTVIKAPGGFLMQSPYLAIANKAQQQMTKLLVEFGMSPSSRSRVTPVEQREDDTFANWESRRRSK